MRSPRILVVDRTEELAEQVQRVAEQLRPRPEVETCERLGLVPAVLDEDGPFDVVVAGPSTATKSGLAKLETLRLDQQGLALVLTFTKRPDADLRDIIRTGAIDVLKLPADEESLSGLLERALEASRLRSPASNGAGGQPPRRTATILTVASASGGSGKTFLATNMAYFLHHRTGRSTCIVDLDLEFGQVASFLRLRGDQSVVDAAQKLQGEEAEPGPVVREHLVTHDTGIEVLAAPKDPSDADLVQPDQIVRLLEVLRCEFDYLVVDTPSALAETILPVFDMTDELFVMATLDVPSLRTIGTLTNTLEKLGVPADEVSLVLNKVEPDVGIDIEQVDKLFPRGFTITLPYTSQVSKSVNLGTPILAYAPNAPISRQLANGLQTVLDRAAAGSTDAGEGAGAGQDGQGVNGQAAGTKPGAEPTSLLSRLFKRSSPARGRP